MFTARSMQSVCGPACVERQKAKFTRFPMTWEFVDKFLRRAVRHRFDVDLFECASIGDKHEDLGSFTYSSYQKARTSLWQDRKRDSCWKPGTWNSTKGQ